MNRQMVLNVLADRPVAYHPDIARVCGGVKAGVFFSQLLYWSDKGKSLDGWIWKTGEQWEEETALTRYEQEGARKLLKQKHFIDEDLRGVPAKMHYKVKTAVFIEALELFYQQQTSLRKTSKLVGGEPANKDGENGETITESTTEITPDKILCATEKCFEGVDIEGMKCTWCTVRETWCGLFPNKTQPAIGNKSLKDKLATRWKDTQFRNRWKASIEKASKSPHLVKEGWFQLEYLLRNDRNYLKVLDGVFDGFDDDLRQKKSKVTHKTPDTANRKGGAF